VHARGAVGLKHHHDAAAPEPVELDQDGAVVPPEHHEAGAPVLTPALADTAAKFDSPAPSAPTKGA
jgi:hypothetical protein